MRKHILMNSIWGNLNVLLRYALSFIAITIVASNFGPEEFGLYQLALTYVALIDGINLISPTYIRNYLAANHDNEKLVVGSWILNSIIINLMVIVFFIYMWFDRGVDGLFVLLAISSVRIVFRIFDYTQILVDSRLRSDLVQKIQISSNGIFNIGRIVIATMGGSIKEVASASVLQGIASSAHGLYVSKKIGAPIWGDFNISFLYKIMKASLALTFATFLGIFQLRIFGILLSHKMPMDSYGSLQLVLKVIEPITAIGTILIGANYTILAKSFQESRSIFLKRFGKISILTILSSLALSFSVVIVPKDLLINIFGHKYESGLDLLWIGPLVVFANVIFSIMIQYYTISQEYAATVVKYAMVIIGYFIFYFLMDSISISDGLFISALVPIATTLLFFACSVLIKKVKSGKFH